MTTAKEVNILNCNNCGKAYVTENENSKYCLKKDCSHKAAAEHFKETFKLE